MYKAGNIGILDFLVEIQSQVKLLLMEFVRKPNFSYSKKKMRWREYSRKTKASKLLSRFVQYQTVTIPEGNCVLHLTKRIPGPQLLLSTKTEPEVERNQKVPSVRFFDKMYHEIRTCSCFHVLV